MIGKFKYAKGDSISQEESVRLAATLTPPVWATHVAVRYDGSKIEPAQWNEVYKEFMDQDIRNANKGDWVSAYKSYYWSFIPVASSS